MSDVEKVIRGLECCLPPHDPDCDLCPYDSIDLRCRAMLCDDVMALLKAQEPVEPITKKRAYFCGNPCCGRILADMVPSGAPTRKIKYCSECGRAVKWE